MKYNENLNSEIQTTADLLSNFQSVVERVSENAVLHTYRSKVVN